MSLLIEKHTDFARDLELPIHTNEEGELNANTLLNKTVEFIKSELQETEDALEANDDEEIIDGFGDVAFIAINGIYKTFRTRGLNHIQAHTQTIEVMNRICDANNNKRQKDGTVLIKNKKVQKPEGWKAPTHMDLFNPSEFKKIIDPTQKVA